MHDLVHRQKIARLLNLLALERDPRKRSTLVRLLIDEENQFGFGLKQLAVAEKHLAYCHHHIMVVRRLIDYLNANGDDTGRENDMLQTLTELEASFHGNRRNILDLISS